MNALVDFPKHPNRIPGFSMGYKFERDYSTLAPGPGTYSLDSTPKVSRGIKFSKAVRLRDPEPKSPGPGAYDILNSSLSTSKQSSFGLSPSHTRVGSFTKAPRFMNNQVNENNLGPGAYNIPDSFIKKSKSSTALKGVLSRSTLPKMHSTKKLDNLGNPGPGSYDIPTNSTHISSLNGTFGSAPRDTFDVERLTRGSLEGPNYYSHNHKSNLFEGPGIKFRQSKRRDLIMKEVKDVPGPGAYDVSIRRHKSQNSKGTFGTAVKLEDPMIRIRREEPGPGEYPVPNTSFEKGVRFGTGSRDTSPKEVSPGPGAYNIVDDFCKVPKKNQKELELIKRISLQAMYTRSTVATQELSTTNIQSLTEGGSLNNSKINKMSPHILRLRQSLELKSHLKDSSAKGSKENSSRKSIFDELISQSQSPGPVYKVDINTIASTLGEVGTKFPSAPKLGVEDNGLPGPGAYSQESPLDMRGGIFLLGKRTEDSMVNPSSRDVPGVGTYDIPEQKVRIGPKFGKASRWKDLGNNHIPNFSSNKTGADDFFF